MPKSEIKSKQSGIRSLSRDSGLFPPRVVWAREQGWLAASPLGCYVLDRESAAYFLRSKQTTFPGQKLAEIFGVTEGPLKEEMDRNILHVNGDDHRRLRNLVNPAFTPRAADRPNRIETTAPFPTLGGTS